MEPETIKFKLHYSSAYKKRIFASIAIKSLVIAFFVTVTIIDFLWVNFGLACIFAFRLLCDIWELPISVIADDNGLTLREAIGRTKVKRSEIVSIQPLSALDGSVELKWLRYDVKLGEKTMYPVSAFVTDDKHIAVVTVKEPKRTAYQYALSCPDEATLEKLCKWGS